MTKPAAFHATVHGHVQGVNFRYFVIQKARSMGIKGYVANLEDGITVEVYAEGKKDELDELLQLLHIGPARADVDFVNVEWLQPKGRLNRFEVQY